MDGAAAGASPDLGSGHIGPVPTMALGPSLAMVRDTGSGLTCLGIARDTGDGGKGIWTEQVGLNF